MQNADDTKHLLLRDGESPGIEFVTFSSGVVLVANEDGFSESDVRAITTVAQSTKVRQNAPTVCDPCDLDNLEQRKMWQEEEFARNQKSSEGLQRVTIGQKGIGFKSVVARSQNVYIFSRGFQFRLGPSNIDAYTP